MQINKNVRTFMICVKSNLKHTLSQTNYSYKFLKPKTK